MTVGGRSRLKAPAPSRFTPRGRHLFVFDLFAVSGAIVGAFALRFDATDIGLTIAPYLPVALLPLLLQPLANVAFGLYRREWRYASLREMIGVMSAVAGATVVGAIVFVILSALGFPGTAGMPRSFFPLEGLLSLTLVGGGRFALRWALETSNGSGETDEEVGGATIVYGAGEAGAAMLRFADRDARMRVRVVGYLDDDPHKAGSRLGGKKIYGGLDQLNDAVRSTRARRLVIAMPSAPGATVRKAVLQGRALGLDVAILPHFDELLGPHDRIARVRPVVLEDLLRREPVTIDVRELADYLNGTTVLVTGGGGSIGSELARQILTLGPRRLVIMDNSEAALWRIEQELAENRTGPPQVVQAVMCDVRNAPAVQHLFDKFEPEIVFHAAALKHVPMCEMQPAEAVMTNVVGTQNILDAVASSNVGRFVLISTDKAVHPVSVMGATKRLAEMATLQAGRRAGRPHLAVRFGNVLGSSGSVVPIFQRQLEQGLPITITHPDATRYFMTIPEAVSLILEVGASDAVADVFILDMGKPVRIVDLAEDMIRLSGLDPEAVKIIFTGLRPGERLDERLFYDHEDKQKTSHSRIWRSSSTEFDMPVAPIDLLRGLAAAAAASDDRKVRELLSRSGVLHATADRGPADGEPAEIGTR